MSVHKCFLEFENNLDNYEIRKLHYIACRCSTEIKFRKLYTQIKLLLKKQFRTNRINLSTAQSVSNNIRHLKEKFDECFDVEESFCFNLHEMDQIKNDICSILSQLQVVSSSNDIQLSD